LKFYRALKTPSMHSSYGPIPSSESNLAALEI